MNEHTMQKNMISILAITNLYPVPWAKHRASFNQQQFSLLAEQFPLRILILVPWLEWLKNKTYCNDSSEKAYVPYFYLPGFGRHLTPYFQYISLLIKRKWINQTKISHILASWAYPDAVACLMYANKHGIKVLVKAHGTDVNENTLHTSRVKQMKKWLNRAITIFCASKDLANKLTNIGVDPAKLCVNYNGVNPEIFYPSSEHERSSGIVFIGNLLTSKGVYELLDAYHLLMSDNLPKLHIIGQGPEKQRILERLTLLGLQNQVILHGALPLQDVANKLRHAELLVLPSYREGVPNVILEAFASGVPVVASDVGGIPEVVSEGTGLLTSAKDAEALAQTIKLALTQSWSKNRLAEHAKQFSWSHNINTFNNRMTLDE